VKQPDREQTASEELANSLTHGIGLALSVACLVLLVVLAALKGTAWHVASCSVYGATLVLLYAASTCYHGVRSPRAKRVWNAIDHSAIYLLVAGTYTPFVLVTLRGALGWTIFGVVWGFALAGILFQNIFLNRFQVFSLLTYLAMGWMAMAMLPRLLQCLPRAGLVWLFAGGLCYTLGIAFFAWKRQPYAHAVWHVFVLAGSLCHFFGILFFVVL